MVWHSSALLFQFPPFSSTLVKNQLAIIMFPPSFLSTCLIIQCQIQCWPWEIPFPTPYSELTTLHTPETINHSSVFYFLHRTSHLYCNHGTSSSSEIIRPPSETIRFNSVSLSPKPQLLQPSWNYRFSVFAPLAPPRPKPAHSRC